MGLSVTAHVRVLSEGSLYGMLRCLKISSSLFTGRDGPCIGTQTSRSNFGPLFVENHLMPTVYIRLGGWTHACMVVYSRY
jgi:hypothetical protein